MKKIHYLHVIIFVITFSKFQLKGQGPLTPGSHIANSNLREDNPLTQNSIEVDKARISIAKGFENDDPFAEQEWLHIFPNPNRGDFLVELNFAENKGWFDMEVRDQEGRIVHFENYTITKQNHQMIELDKKIPSGIYFIRVNNGTEIFQAKMLLAK